MASLGFFIWKVLVICKTPLWVLSCKVGPKLPVWLPDYDNATLSAHLHEIGLVCPWFLFMCCCLVFSSFSVRLSISSISTATPNVTECSAVYLDCVAEVFQRLTHGVSWNRLKLFRMRAYLTSIEYRWIGFLKRQCFASNLAFWFICILSHNHWHIHEFLSFVL